MISTVYVLFVSDAIIDMFTISLYFSKVKDPGLEGCQCHNRTFENSCLPIYIQVQGCGPGTSSTDQICCADVEEADLNEIVNFSDEDPKMGVGEEGKVHESQSEQIKEGDGKTDQNKGGDGKPYKKKVPLDRHGRPRRMGKFRRRLKL